MELRRRRRILGLSRQTLASKLGVHRNTIERLEVDKVAVRGCRFEYIQALSQELRWPVHDMLRLAFPGDQIL